MSRIDHEELWTLVEPCRKYASVDYYKGYLCKNCEKVVVYPRWIYSCGHLYCLACVDEKCCEVDHSSTESKQRLWSEGVFLKFQAIGFRCKYCDSGCLRWSQAQQHLKQKHNLDLSSAEVGESAAAAEPGPRGAASRTRAEPRSARGDDAATLQPGDPHSACADCRSREKLLVLKMQQLESQVAGLLAETKRLSSGGGGCTHAPPYTVLVWRADLTQYNREMESSAPFPLRPGPEPSHQLQLQLSTTATGLRWPLKLLLRVKQTPLDPLLQWPPPHTLRISVIADGGPSNDTLSLEQDPFRRPQYSIEPAVTVLDFGNCGEQWLCERSLFVRCEVLR